MLQRLLVYLLFIALLSAAPPDRKKLGSVEFFGYEGLDVTAARAAFPIRIGEAFASERPWARWQETIRAAMRQATGQTVTDIAKVCCDDHGDYRIFVGLVGKSSRPIVFHAAPRGAERLPAAVGEAYAGFERAAEAAVRQGDSGEDRAEGYSLFHNPKARAYQLQLRDAAQQQEELVMRVARECASSHQRAIAADLLGYLAPSQRQVDALLYSTLDTDEETRNNAIRALMVLAEAKPEWVPRIDPTPLFQLVYSPFWTDRHKAAALLTAMTRSRPPELLQRIRNEALVPITEIARWRNFGHAFAGRFIIGRLAGIPEEQLEKIVYSDDLDALFAAR